MSNAIELDELEIVKPKNNMKVVLFCGGMGMRMREYSETVPNRWYQSGIDRSSGM